MTFLYPFHSLFVSDRIHNTSINLIGYQKWLIIIPKSHFFKFQIKMSEMKISQQKDPCINFPKDTFQKNVKLRR